MSWQTESLGNLLMPAGNSRAGKQDLPILSITMHGGLVDQSEKFRKRVASRDISSYRVVFANELVVGFPIDEGVLGFQTKYPAAVVSPAYSVWRLRRLADTHIPFIERYLRSDQARQIYAEKMRGAVARRRSISNEAFLGIEIPFPPVEEQKRIAAVLDDSETLRHRRQQSLALIENLVQSLFIQMFGDPVTNPKGWPMLHLAEFGLIQTGNTPPRTNKANYSAIGLEWIKTDNIVEDRVYVTSAVEKLSVIGEETARTAAAGSLLVACIAGSVKSIGRAALTDRLVAFNQQINSVTPYSDVSSLFLYFLMKVARRQVQLVAGKGMKKIINKTTFESLTFIAPDEENQRRFEKIALHLISQSQDCRDQLSHLDALYSSIQKRAFGGALDLSRVVLDPPADVPSAPEPESTGSSTKELNAAVQLLPAPETLEATLDGLEEVVSKGESIPWSADYFKYRVLGVKSAPFSFREVMEKAESIFENPPYEQIKDIVFELLGKGGVRAYLSQRFDIHLDAEANDSSGRKEIIFEPTI